MSETKLKLVPPSVTDERSWALVLNCLYGCRKDDLFTWLKRVKEHVEATENEKRRGAA